MPVTPAFALNAALGAVVRLEGAGLGHLRSKPDAIVFHDLRHTFGTLAIRCAPVTDVQHWMGHADIQATMRYVHYVPQHDNAAKLTAAFTAESMPAEPIRPKPAAVTS